MTKISIIIPCYNGWNDMSRCLDSIEKQTCRPYEIIIADDCSTDDSFEKVEKYIKTSSLNIVHIKNEKNSGPGVTREKAYRKSTGDYIAFCDCDDWYELTFIQKVSAAIEATSSDLIICDNYISFDTKKINSNTVSPLVGKDKKYILAYYPMSLCRMTVRRTLFEGVVFPPLYNGEDGAVVPQVIANAESIQIIDEPLYNYYFREGSASNKPSRIAYLNMLEAFKSVEMIFDKYPEECEFLGIKMVCYGTTLNAFKIGVANSEIFRIMDEFKKKYPRWGKNKYLESYSKIKKIYLSFLQKRLYRLARLMANMHYAYTKKK